MLFLKLTNRLIKIFLQNNNLKQKVFQGNQGNSVKVYLPPLIQPAEEIFKKIRIIKKVTLEINSDCRMHLAIKSYRGAVVVSSWTWHINTFLERHEINNSEQSLRILAELFKCYPSEYIIQLLIKGIA